MVPLAGRGESRDRELAAALQRSAAPFEPLLSDAGGIRGRTGETSAPPCNGPGRCGIWGLRAPARCITALPGARTRSRRLNLTVVATPAGDVRGLEKIG